MRRGLTPEVRKKLDRRFQAIVERLDDKLRAQMGSELQDTLQKMADLGAQGKEDEGVELAKVFAARWELLAGL